MPNISLTFPFVLPQNFPVSDEYQMKKTNPETTWTVKIKRLEDNALEIELISARINAAPGQGDHVGVVVSVENRKDPRNNFIWHPGNQIFSWSLQKACFKLKNLSNFLNPATGFVENGQIQLSVLLSIISFDHVHVYVEDKEFRFERENLQWFSKKFSEILKESNFIELEDVKFAEVLDFLRFIDVNESGKKPENAKIAPGWCLKSILKMAKKYECPPITSAIEFHLINEKSMGIPEKLALAREFELDKLINECMKLIMESGDNQKDLKFDDFSTKNWRGLAIERASKKGETNDENVDPKLLFSYKKDTSSPISSGKLLINDFYLDNKFSFHFPIGRLKETMCEWTLLPRSCDSTGNLFVTVQCHESSKSSLWSYKLVFLLEIKSEKNPIQTFRRLASAEFDIHHKSVDIFIGKMSRFKNSHFISKLDNKIQIHGRLIALRKCGVYGKWLEPLRNADMRNVVSIKKMLNYQLALAQKEVQIAEKLLIENKNHGEIARALEKTKESMKIDEISARICGPNYTEIQSSPIQSFTGEQMRGCLELGAQFHCTRFLERCGKLLIGAALSLELKLEFAEKFKLVELQEHCLEELKNQKDASGVILKLEPNDFDKKTWCLLARL